MFPILFILCSFLVQARFPVNVNISSAKGLQQRVDDKMTHTELKGITVMQTLSPRKPVFKSFNGTVPAFGQFTSRPVVTGCFVLPVFRQGHAKSYLLHIYPSLHFW